MILHSPPPSNHHLDLTTADNNHPPPLPRTIPKPQLNTPKEANAVNAGCKKNPDRPVGKRNDWYLDKYECPSTFSPSAEGFHSRERCRRCTPPRWSIYRAHAALSHRIALKYSLNTVLHLPLNSQSRVSRRSAHARP